MATLPSFDSVFGGNRWLEARLKGDPNQPDPHYAREGTLSWMRALSILCEQDMDNRTLKAKYDHIQRRPVDRVADNAVFVSMLMSIQNLSGLIELSNSKNPSLLIRTAIVSWYYGMYYAARAMVCSKQPTIPNTHRGTAKTWDACIAQRGLASGPFSLRLSTLVKKDYELEAGNLKGGITFSLPGKPSDPSQALGAHVSYLKNTASNARDEAEAKLKKEKPFKDQFSDFLKKEARTMRDARLSNTPTCFLDLAFRYRGKAHYRDALFFGYADTPGDDADQFIYDLVQTLCTFTRMSAHLSMKCVERGTWKEFISDLKESPPLTSALEALQSGIVKTGSE